MSVCDGAGRFLCPSPLNFISDYTQILPGKNKHAPVVLILLLLNKKYAENTYSFVCEQRARESERARERERESTLTGGVISQWASFIVAKQWLSWVVWV